MDALETLLLPDEAEYPGELTEGFELLERMAGITDREASFECALALKLPGEEPIIAEGHCPGTLLYKRQGTGGFGYDPLFLYEPLNKTFAELNGEEKNSVSHRARACEAMIKLLEKRLKDTKSD